MPAEAGQRLNLRDLEQGLEQLNRLISNQVRLQFLPGEQPGGTKVLVDNQPAKTWRASVNYNNSGQQSTGEQQRGLFMDWDSPLNYNDYIYLSYQGDVKNDNTDGKGSENLALHYDLPYGYWNISFDASWSEYLTTVTGQLSPFQFSGKSNQQRLGLSRIIARGQQSKWRLAGSLIRKDSKNYVADILIDVNSRTLSMAGLELSYWWYFKNAALFRANLGYQQGLKWFNAPSDKHQDENFPKAQFTKYTLELEYQHPFQWGAQNGYWQSTFKGQYSDDSLYGTEKLSVGSQYSIRAYKEHGLSGDSGAYLRNELSIPLPSSWLQRVTGKAQLTTGFDIGHVRYQGIETHHWQSLKGWFVGAGWSSPYVNMSLSYSRPIDAPEWLNAESSVTYFNLSLNY